MTIENTPTATTAPVPPANAQSEQVPKMQENASIEKPTLGSSNAGLDLTTINTRLGELNASAKETVTKINDLRAELGLPPTDEVPPAILLEQKTLLEQQKGLLNQPEEKTVEVTMKDTINELLKELSKLTEEERMQLMQSGTRANGALFYSVKLGLLQPRMIQQLIILQKEFDDDLPLAKIEELEKANPELADAMKKDQPQEEAEQQKTGNVIPFNPNNTQNTATESSPEHKMAA